MEHDLAWLRQAGWKGAGRRLRGWNHNFEATQTRELNTIITGRELGNREKVLATFLSQARSYSIKPAGSPRRSRNE